jgi:hypothetical protein
MAQLAQAHAILIDSFPANGQTVAQDKLSVELHFNCRIDVRHSRLWLANSDDANIVLPLDDAAPPNTLKVDSLEVEPGAYHLRWQVLSVDGHITRGEISFRVSR